MGSQGSTSNSAPVSAADRLKSYNAGWDAMGGNQQLGGADQAPTTERLGEGDYAKVQAGLEAPIQRQQDLALKQNDQAMSDRGIYTSLNALRSNDSTRETYAPQFAGTGVALANLKAGDIAATNTANMENANRQYESSWRPADYRAGLWNGTGGTISSGSSGGWSI